jgi:hypothetical protein
VQHFINGKLTADVTDNDPELAPKSGVIALQLHAGQPNDDSVPARSS